MKKVLLVPTNFSRESRHSLQFAIDMAADLDAVVRLLHVVEARSYFPEATQADLASTFLVDAAWERMGQLELEARRYARDRVDITTSVRLGQFDAALAGFCEESKPFAAVMSSRGKAGPVERFFLGSNVLAAVRVLDTPLVVVPPEAAYKGVKLMGLACDLHDAEELIPIERVKEWASAFHAGLDILNVCEGDWGWEAQEVTRLGASRLRKAFGKPVPACHFIYSRSIEKGLFTYADNHNVDLLAVFPRERFRFWALFEKAHSSHLTVHPPVPLVIMHR